MADFWQHGPITVLQRLRDRSVEDLDREITAIARRRKVVLLLPALFSEFETPAMPKIIAELKKVNYLHAVILSLDNANEDEFKNAREIMSRITCPVKVVWHDGPGMQSTTRSCAKTISDWRTPARVSPSG